MEYTHPFMLVDGDVQAMEQRYNPGTFDDSLTESARYLEGELVSVVSGLVTKSVITTPANIQPLFLAGQDWEQPFAKPYLRDMGVPLNVIPRNNFFVFTYQHDALNDANHEFAAGDFQAVVNGALRELVYNTVEGCYTIRDGSTNPTVQLVGIFKGAVGDDNVRVIARILPDFLGS
jgi:hypothetical protein